MKCWFVWEGNFSDLYASTIKNSNFRQNASEVLSQDFSEYCFIAGMRELDKNTAVMQRHVQWLSPCTSSGSKGRSFKLFISHSSSLGLEDKLGQDVKMKHCFDWGRNNITTVFLFALRINSRFPYTAAFFLTFLASQHMWNLFQTLKMSFTLTSRLSGFRKGEIHSKDALYDFILKGKKKKFLKGKKSLALGTVKTHDLFFDVCYPESAWSKGPQSS